VCAFRGRWSLDLTDQDFFPAVTIKYATCGSHIANAHHLPRVDQMSRILPCQTRRPRGLRAACRQAKLQQQVFTTRTYSKRSTEFGNTFRTHQSTLQISVCIYTAADCTWCKQTFHTSVVSEARLAPFDTSADHSERENICPAACPSLSLFDTPQTSYFKVQLETDSHLEARQTVGFSTNDLYFPQHSLKERPTV
jgi:hypothetical protein